MATSNPLLRKLLILDDESKSYSSSSTTVYPSTILDQVFDQNTPDEKTLRTILEELRQEIINGGIGNISFPVVSVNEMQGDVVITKYHIGLDKVDNTPDTEKPLSGPQRKSVLEMIQNHKFEVDLTDLYNHINQGGNPHGTTFADIDNGEVGELISTAVQQHNQDITAHPDIRNSVSSITDKVEKRIDQVEAHISRVIDTFSSHITNETDAHPTLFDKKEDKVNKVVSFEEEVSNETYPSTKAVSDYVSKQLTEFDKSSVNTLKRVIDVFVVDDRESLPKADADSFNKLYFIRHGLTNYSEIAICRLSSDQISYEWDYTTMGDITKYNPEHFDTENIDGLTLNIDAITNDILQNDLVNIKLLGILNTAINSKMKDYVTREEYDAMPGVKSIQILTGIQSGTIRYQINNDPETMSEDIPVAGIKKLAYLEKVNSDYIDENSVHHQHIANRSIEHRHLRDKVVAAHNMYAPYMTFFGNIDDLDGLTVKPIPMKYLVGLLEDMFKSWMQGEGNADWLKGWIDDLVRQRVNAYFGWADPAAHIRVYMDDHGDLIEQGDEDYSPRMRIDETGHLQMNEADKGLLGYTEMLRCVYDVIDPYLMLNIDTIEDADPMIASRYGDIQLVHTYCSRTQEDCERPCEDHKVCVIEGNRSPYTTIRISEAEFVKNDQGVWQTAVRVQCPFAADGHCEKYGIYCDKCKVGFKSKLYGTDEYKLHEYGKLACSQIPGNGTITQFITITEDQLQNPNTSNGLVKHELKFNWDTEGVYEQNVEILIDPNKIKLFDSDKQTLVWPKIDPANLPLIDIEHDYCDRVNCDYSYCSMSGNKTIHAVANIEDAIFTGEGDDCIFTPGIHIQCPYAINGGKGCSKYPDPTKCHIKGRHNLPNGDEEVFDIGGAASCDAQTQSFGDIYLILQMNKYNLSNAKTLGTRATHSFSVDWNEDNHYEQTIDISINPDKVTLNDSDGNKVWPEETT